MQAERPSSPIRNAPTWIPFLVGVVLIWASSVVSRALVHASFEHWRIGLLMGLIFGTMLALLVAIPLASVAFLLTRSVVNHSGVGGGRRFGLLLLPSVIASCLLLLPGLSSLDPRARFQRHVTKNVPESVKVLSAEGFTGFLAHRWLVVFDVSPQDFETVIRSCGMEKLSPFDYLGAMDSYTARKVDPLTVPQFYGWSASNQVPRHWRDAVANSNHTRVYFMTGFQN